MENTLRNIRLMTAVERNLCVLQFRDLIMDVWDLIGCDYKENLDKVNKVIEFKEPIEEIIDKLKYEYTSNQFIKYHESSIFNYFVKEENLYMITQWDFLDNMTIVKTVVRQIICKEIKQTIDLVLATPLEECNYKIND